MVLNVTIVDSRPDWMRKEDGDYACYRCSFYKHCSSRIGYECNRLGGSEIPKIRGVIGNGQRQKSKPGHRKGKKRRV